jgi:translation initiation factor eIF-2B subunit epsilon
MNLENGQSFSKRGSIWQERGISIASAQVKNAVIGSRTTIKEGAVITNSILGRHCIISPGAVIQDSILWNNVTVNQGVKVNRTIIAAHNILPTNCQIGGSLVIPPNSSISNETIAESKSFTIYGKHPAAPSEDVFDDSDNEDEPIPICISPFV